MPTTQSGSTIVRNTSGGTLYFSFLGRHGATLDDGDDLEIPGNLFTMWKDHETKRSALNYALQNNLIEVLKTPDVFGFDETAEMVYKLGFDDDAPVAVPPDYGSYTGDAPSV